MSETKAVEPTEVFTLFKGWSNHDCSPSLVGVFSTYEKAMERAKALEKKDIKEHKKRYPKGVICWHTQRQYMTDHCYYSASYSRSTKNDTEFGDEVIYIQRIELDR